MRAELIWRSESFGRPGRKTLPVLHQLREGKHTFVPWTWYNFSLWLHRCACDTARIVASFEFR